MPDLRALLDPARLPEWCAAARQMDSDTAETALVTLAALEKALSLRVSADHAQPKVDTQAVGERLLTVTDAAERMGVSVRWMRDHPDLPFRVRLSPRRVRYSEAGLTKYLRQKSLA